MFRFCLKLFSRQLGKTRAFWKLMVCLLFRLNISTRHYLKNHKIVSNIFGQAPDFRRGFWIIMVMITKRSKIPQRNWRRCNKVILCIDSHVWAPERSSHLHVNMNWYIIFYDNCHWAHKSPAWAFFCHDLIKFKQVCFSTDIPFDLAVYCNIGLLSQSLSKNGSKCCALLRAKQRSPQKNLSFCTDEFVYL